jgi:hypothetical protein
MLRYGVFKHVRIEKRPGKCYGTVCLNTFELKKRSGKCYGTVCLNTFELNKIKKSRNPFQFYK